MCLEIFSEEAPCGSILVNDHFPYATTKLGGRYVPGGGGGGRPNMGYIGMCRCEGYGFQAVYSSIEYINQIVWV